MSRRLLHQGWVLLGVGAASLGAGTQGTIQVLPPRVEGIPMISADRVRQGIQKGLLTWEVVARECDQGLRLATRLTPGKHASLVLESLILPRWGETPLFRKTYHAPIQLLDRMLTRLVDDLSERLGGKRTPALNPLIAVQDEGHGVSEIVLTDAAGSLIRPLTHHRSRSLSPSSVRKGRFAYVTYVSGPPEIWGMDLMDRQPHKLYASPRGRGSVSRLALAPDGSSLAFTETDRDGRPIIRLLNWDTGESKDLTSARSELEAPEWSPDGKRLACLQRTHSGTNLVILDRNGGELQRISFQDRLAGSPSWSPAGDRMAVVTEPGRTGSELRLIELATGAAETLFAAASPISSPRWHPTLPWMAFVLPLEGVRMIQVETKASHRILAGGNPPYSPRWVWPS